MRDLTTELEIRQNELYLAMREVESMPASEGQTACMAVLGDESGGKGSYWLRRAAAMLDCAVQCCGTDDSVEIDAMESRCDALADKLKTEGR